MKLLKGLRALAAWPAAWLLVMFVILAGAYAVVTPLFEASDELWHYPLVQLLSRGGPLPIQDPKNVGPWRQEASQPPLYYYLMGWATAWIDSSDMAQIRWLNPHVDNGVITRDGNINLAIHTSAENWPWRGTVLAVRLARFLSVLMSAGTVYFTYRLAAEYFQDEVSRLAAAGAVAFVPMFAFISGAVNNDNLASLLSAIILFWLVFLIRRPNRFNWRHALGVGVALGLAALTKQSALGLFPLTGLTLVALSLLRTGWDLSREALLRHGSFVAGGALTVFVPALLIPAPWYYRNVVLYGDLLGWNGFITILGRRAAPASLAQLWGERESFARSFWGLFGGVNVPMGDWIYVAFNLIALAALLGFAVFAAQSLLGLRVALARDTTAGRSTATAATLAESIDRWFPWALVLGMVGFLAYGLYQWSVITWSSQGRLVFTGISAIGVIFAGGLRALIPVRARFWLLGSIMVFMAGVAAAAPFVFIAPKYQDPPQLTGSQLASISRRLDVDFGSSNFPPEMRLLGYSLDVASVKPGGTLPLTLYWQSLIQMDRDWSVFVHLVDENGIIVAHRDVFPGLGLMPTRKWRVGQTLADTYILQIPATTYAPSAAALEVGLYDYVTGDRLLIVTDGNTAAGRDALPVGPIAITANPGQVPNPQSIDFGGQIELIGYDMDRRALRPGGALNLTLYWRGLRSLTTNYSVFAHVRGEGETLWAGHDSWPLEGAAPTAAWTAGQVVRESRPLKLQAGTPAGDYAVEVGLYDATGQRLQIVLPDGRLTDNFVYLARVKVLP